MSEIFNFLNKSGSGTKKESSSPIPSALDTNQAFEPESAPLLPPKESYESIENQTKVSVANYFDVSNGNYELKCILDPFTFAGEQFRLLRTKLNFMRKQKELQTVLVTSSIPEEGKSLTACGLASVFSQESGKRVLLIDCDIRKPGSGQYLGVIASNANSGLSDVLQGNIKFMDALIKSKDSDLYFLPSGSLPSNPMELIDSPVMESIIKSAVEYFDWVVIDTPPILAYSDAVSLSPLCDAIILVIRANSTSSKLVKDAIERIGKERICGILFNRQKKINSARYLHKYYGRSE